MTTINLYQKIFVILNNTLPNLAKEWQSKFPVNNANHSIDEQISNINNYWRSKLAKSKHSTLDARACLIHYEDYKAWLGDFETVVIPAIKDMSSK